MESIKIIKESLRIIGSKYVNSKQIDGNSYKIAFAYKNRNYSLDINKYYKFIMLSTTESIYGMDLNDDTLDLIDYIKQMIFFTKFENYNIFSFSLRKEIIDNEFYDTLQVIKEMDEFDSILDVENPKQIIENNEYKAIEYNFGLNTFDKRLFDEDIFEDFNEKVTTFCEEDLYLIYATLISYFYKLINGLWKSDKIDPYIMHCL